MGAGWAVCEGKEKHTRASWGTPVGLSGRCANVGSVKAESGLATGVTVEGLC